MGFESSHLLLRLATRESELAVLKSGTTKRAFVVRLFVSVSEAVDKSVRTLTSSDQ